MYKKTVTFENFDGETVTEDFYFNLTKAELLELEVSEEGGFSETMQEIVKAGNGKEIIAGFKRILLMSVGKRRGQSFVKNQEIREEFEGSPAFSELFMELATNAQAGAEFVNGVIPAGLAKQVEGQLPLEPAQVPDIPTPIETTVEDIQVTPPQPDFASMSPEEFAAWRDSNGM